MSWTSSGIVQSSSDQAFGCDRFKLALELRARRADADLVGVALKTRRAGASVLAFTLLACLTAAAPARPAAPPELPPVEPVEPVVPVEPELPPGLLIEPEPGPAEPFAPQLGIIGELLEVPPGAADPQLLTGVSEENDSARPAPDAPGKRRTVAGLSEPATHDLHRGNPQSLSASLPAAPTVAAGGGARREPRVARGPSRDRRSAVVGGAGLEARSVAATTAVPPADDGLLGAAGALVGYLPEWVKALLALMSTVLAGLLLVVLISRRQLAQALRRAHFDVLTGLPNRAAIDEALHRRVAQAARNGSPLGVAMLDIDDFKAINDDYGHTKGDEVLTAVGAVARRTVRSGDLVGRFGGEELVLILPDTDQTGARAAAEKLRLALGEVTLPGLERRITASVGVAAAQGDRAALEGLIAAADAAMYRAKAMGRDRSEVASDLDRALARL